MIPKRIWQPLCNKLQYWAVSLVWWHFTWCTQFLFFLCYVGCCCGAEGSSIYTTHMKTDFLNPFFLLSFWLDTHLHVNVALWTWKNMKSQEVVLWFLIHWSWPVVVGNFLILRWKRHNKWRNLGGFLCLSTWIYKLLQYGRQQRQHISLPPLSSPVNFCLAPCLPSMWKP